MAHNNICAPDDQLWPVIGVTCYVASQTGGILCDKNKSKFRIKSLKIHQMQQDCIIKYQKILKSGLMIMLHCRDNNNHQTLPAPEKMLNLSSPFISPSSSSRKKKMYVVNKIRQYIYKLVPDLPGSHPLNTHSIPLIFYGQV